MGRARSLHLLLVIAVVAPGLAQGGQTVLTADRYMKAVCSFADAVLAHGRDT